MPWLNLPGGIVAHVKMAKPRRHRCCGSEGGHPCHAAATIQCDYQLGNGKTCSAWCCGAHALSVGPDLDHCPVHAKARQGGLFAGTDGVPPTDPKQEKPHG